MRRVFIEVLVDENEIERAELLLDALRDCVTKTSTDHDLAALVEDAGIQDV